MPQAMPRPNGEELDTAAIITTTANRALATLHDRMPVFVAPEAFDMWLDCANVEADVAAALIKPADESLLEVYPVSTAVNRVANDSEMLIAPAADESAVQAAPAPSVATMAKKPKKAKEPDGQTSLF
jgi:putative SOS response-associated peptidase YedK